MEGFGWVSRETDDILRVFFSESPDFTSISPTFEPKTPDERPIYNIWVACVHLAYTISNKMSGSLSVTIFCLCYSSAYHLNVISTGLAHRMESLPQEFLFPFWTFLYGSFFSSFALSTITFIPKHSFPKHKWQMTNLLQNLFSGYSLINKMRYTFSVHIFGIKLFSRAFTHKRTVCVTRMYTIKNISVNEINSMLPFCVAKYRCSLSNRNHFILFSPFFVSCLSLPDGLK